LVLLDLKDLKEFKEIRGQLDPKEFKERFGFEPIEDRQLQAALDVLKGLRVLGERSGRPASQ
jgi:hypothetical protein